VKPIRKGDTVTVGDAETKVLKVIRADCATFYVVEGREWAVSEGEVEHE
jgi:hypothetical protein